MKDKIIGIATLLSIPLYYWLSQRTIEGYREREEDWTTVFEDMAFQKMVIYTVFATIIGIYMLLR